MLCYSASHPVQLVICIRDRAIPWKKVRLDHMELDFRSRRKFLCLLLKVTEPLVCQQVEHSVSGILLVPNLRKFPLPQVWNTVTLSSPVILEAGTYTLSYGAFTTTFDSYPKTLNGITMINTYGHNTIGNFPDSVSGWSQYLGIDFVFAVKDVKIAPPATSTSAKIITLPDKTGTVVVDTDISTMVTETSTNTSGNVMTGGGTRTITDSGKALTSLVTGPRASVRTLYARYDPTSGSSISADTNYGFGTATYNTTGQYSLTFSTAFNEVPVINVTCVVDNTSYNWKAIPYVRAPTTSGCDIYILEPAVAWRDLKFHISVIGY